MVVEHVGRCEDETLAPDVRALLVATHPPGRLAVCEASEYARDVRGSAWDRGADSVDGVVEPFAR